MKLIASAADTGPAAPRARSAIGAHAGRAGAFDDLIAGLGADDQATSGASAQGDALSAGPAAAIAPAVDTAVAASSAWAETASSPPEALDLAPLLAKIVAAPAIGARADDAASDPAGTNDSTPPGTAVASPSGVSPSAVSIATPASLLAVLAAATAPAAPATSTGSPDAAVSPIAPAADLQPVSGRLAADPRPDLGTVTLPDQAPTLVSGLAVTSYIAPAASMAVATRASSAPAGLQPAASGGVAVPDSKLLAPSVPPAQVAAPPAQVAVTVAAAGSDPRSRATNGPLTALSAAVPPASAPLRDAVVPRTSSAVPATIASSSPGEPAASTGVQTRTASPGLALVNTSGGATASDAASPGASGALPVAVDATGEAASGEVLAGGPVRSIAEAVAKLATVPSAAATPADPSRPTAIGPARTLNLQLSPGTLGTVSIRLHLTGDALDLRLEVSNPQTLGLLSRERDSLVAALRDQATTVHSLTIQAGAPPSPGGQDASTFQGTGDEAPPGGAAGRGTGERPSGGQSTQREGRRATGTSAAAPTASPLAGDGLFV